MQPQDRHATGPPSSGWLPTITDTRVPRTILQAHQTCNRTTIFRLAAYHHRHRSTKNHLAGTPDVQQDHHLQAGCLPSQTQEYQEPSCRHTRRATGPPSSGWLPTITDTRVPRTILQAHQTCNRTTIFRLAAYHHRHKSTKNHLAGTPDVQQDHHLQAGCLPSQTQEYQEPSCRHTRRATGPPSSGWLPTITDTRVPRTILQAHQTCNRTTIFRLAAYHHRHKSTKNHLAGTPDVQQDHHLQAGCLPSQTQEYQEPSCRHTRRATGPPSSGWLPTITDTRVPRTILQAHQTCNRTTIFRLAAYHHRHKSTKNHLAGTPDVQQDHHLQAGCLPSQTQEYQEPSCRHTRRATGPPSSGWLPTITDTRVPRTILQAHQTCNRTTIFRLAAYHHRHKSTKNHLAGTPDVQQDHHLQAGCLPSQTQEYREPSSPRGSRSCGRVKTRTICLKITYYIFFFSVTWFSFPCSDLYSLGFRRKRYGESEGSRPEWCISSMIYIVEIHHSGRKPLRILFKNHFSIVQMFTN